MGRKLYVGNLPDSATEQDIADKFAAYGTVKSVKLITDHDTGRTRGFGFIEMWKHMRQSIASTAPTTKAGR